MLDRDCSNILRCLAIFSVICAHVSTADKDTTNLLVSSLGSIGVGLFFLLSGYLYYSNRKDVKIFTISRIKNIIIPWLFCGTLDWLYVVLRKGGIGISGWFDSVFIHSHYYFLTVLMMLFYLLRSVRYNKSILKLLIVISLVSCFMTSKGMISFIYPYINPLNWFFYFVIGLLMANYNCIDIFISISRKILFLSIPLSIYVLLWYIYDGRLISYWGNGNVLFITLLIICQFGIVTYINKNSFLWKILAFIGKISFSIYLIHMPFAGITSKAIEIIDVPQLRLIAPFIVLIVVVLLIEGIRYVSRKLKSEILIKYILGIR